MLSTSKKILYSVLIGLFVLGGLCAAYYYLYSRETSVTGNPSKTEKPYAAIKARSTSFASGERLRTEGKYQQAITAYKVALADSKNKLEEGLVNYKIAYTTSKFDLLASIPKLKAIAANRAYSNYQRASAIQVMGQSHYAIANRKGVTGKIFEGDPYSSFLKDGNVTLAYRKLFEYAANFYPMAISELRVARWYADALLVLKKKKSLTSEDQAQINSYTKTVRERLNLANADIKNMAGLPNDVVMYHQVLTRRAEIIGVMWRAGDMSFGNPEEEFKKVIHTTASMHGDASARFSYAIFLAKLYEGKRKADISPLLEPVYKDFGNYQHYKIVLATSKKNILGNKASLVHLASIDPGLHKALLGLGWQASDFK